MWRNSMANGEWKRNGVVIIISPLKLNGRNGWRKWRNEMAAAKQWHHKLVMMKA